jgi:hypothetical protein
MARTKVERTGQFEAIDDSGASHTITVFTTFIEHAPLSGTAEWIKGLKSHKLNNGSHVNVKEDGTYEAVQTGQILRRAN